MSVRQLNKATCSSSSCTGASTNTGLNLIIFEVFQEEQWSVRGTKLPSTVSSKHSMYIIANAYNL